MDNNSTITYHIYLPCSIKKVKKLITFNIERKISLFCFLFQLKKKKSFIAAKIYDKIIKYINLIYKNRILKDFSNIYISSIEFSNLKQKKGIRFRSKGRFSPLIKKSSYITITIIYG